MDSQLKIERKAQTLARYGLARSTFHARINEGLIPPAVSLGDRAVGFISHETDQVLAFIMAGKSKDEIRALVAHLIEQRQALLEGVMSWTA